MDTAFYNRTGFTTAVTYNEVNFYPKTKHNWLQRITPFMFAKGGKDRIQDGHEYFVNGGLRTNFTKQGNLNIEVARGKEAWLGQEYRVGNDVFVFAGLQPMRWLNFYGGIGTGPSIYYDEVNPFQGRNRGSFFGVTLQPNQHFSESIQGNTARFTRSSNDELIYSVLTLNSRTTYQFDKHLLVRLLTQYDSSAHQVLANFLASYELVPGSVLHAGYGSLVERGAINERPDRYDVTNRGFFFKASYLHRF
jgi:hypothetical protein